MNNVEKGVSSTTVSKLAEYFNPNSWLVLLTTFLYLDTFIMISNKFPNLRQPITLDSFFVLGNLIEFIIITSLVFVILVCVDILSSFVYLNKYVHSYIGTDDSVNISEPYYKASDIFRTAVVKKNGVLLDLYRAWETEMKARLSNRKITYFLFIISLFNVFFQGRLITILSRLVQIEASNTQGLFDVMVCLIIGSLYLLYRLIGRRGSYNNYILLEYGLKDELVKDGIEITQ